MDLDAIFDGDGTATLPAVQPVEAPPPAAVEAIADTPPVVDAPPPVSAPRADDGDRNVPLTALLDTRDKLKAAERRIAEFEAQQRQAPADAPDPYDDPQGFQQHIETQLANQALSLKFDFSESTAREKHGDDAVSAAMEWGAMQAQTNPGFRDEFLKHKNPIDWVVRQQKRDGLLADVGDDADAYVRRRAAEMGWIAAPDAGAGMTPAPGQQQAPRPAAPPRSIANAGTAGGNREVAAMTDEAMFGAIFKG